MIANNHEDNWCEAMEKVWKESAGSDVEARSSGSWSDDDESEDESSADGGDEEETEVDARDTCVDADSSPPKKQKCADLSPSQASYVDEAKEKNHILSDIKKQIMDSSLMGLLPAVERESHVEKRRQLRRMSEDSAVAEALASWQRTECERKQHAAKDIQKFRDRQRDLKNLAAKRKATKAAIQKQKSDLKAFESHCEMNVALKSFLPGCVGQGKVNNGGKDCQKKRFEVLDRMAKHGNGLTAQQRNEWGWLKQHWDAYYTKEHGEDWPTIFLQMINKVHYDMYSEGNPALFSQFVVKETKRIVTELNLVGVSV